jgi:hypothetical protein
MFSRAGESERDFRVRLQQAARERRDQLKAELQSKYGPKAAALEERKRKAEQRREIEKQQATGQILSTAVSVGATLLGALMGRKAMSISTITRASTAVRATGQAAKEYRDGGRAADSVETIDREIAELHARFEQEVSSLDVKINPSTEVLESVVVRPRKTNINVQLVALGWNAR